MDAEEAQTQGRRRRKDVPFHGGGDGGNTYRYACIVVYKLNQGCGRMKNVLFHKWGRGGNTWPQEKEGCPIPQRGKHISLCLYIV